VVTTYVLSPPPSASDSRISLHDGQLVLRGVVAEPVVVTVIEDFVGTTVLDRLDTRTQLDAHAESVIS